MITVQGIILSIMMHILSNREMIESITLIASAYDQVCHVREKIDSMIDRVYGMSDRHDMKYEYIDADMSNGVQRAGPVYRDYWDLNREGVSRELGFVIRDCMLEVKLIVYMFGCQVSERKCRRIKKMYKGFNVDKVPFCEVCKEGIKERRLAIFMPTLSYFDERVLMALHPSCFLAKISDHTEPASFILSNMIQCDHESIPISLGRTIVAKVDYEFNLKQYWQKKYDPRPGLLELRRMRDRDWIELLAEQH